VNRQIRQLAGGLMVCYVILFAALNYWQVGQEEELNARFDNTRAIRREFEEPRGPIVTTDGVIVAESVANPPDSQFKFQRVYPFDELYANITGYYTFAFGSTGVERTENAVLTGSTAEQRLRSIPDLLRGDADDSGSVRLAIRSDLQEVARQAIGEREGSVVVLEPKTGAIRAMWSYPSYDPNLIANPDFEAASAALQFYENFPGEPLLANAYQQRYMPGSTFKVLTTGIALMSGVVDLSTVFPDENEFIPPQTTDPIENFEGTTCGGDLTEVFARSCNIPFAQLALEIGVPRMLAGVAAWGVGETLPVDLPRPAASTFGDNSDLGDRLPLLAIRGFGQNEVQMVPLHMAMVAGAVANGGLMMKPYAVEATLDHDGNLLDRTTPEVWKTPISSEVAETLTGLMEEVARTGTASCCLQLDNGISVAAKTGTAQLNARGEPERSHAWIIAFAPVEDPQFAIAVTLLGTSEEINAGTGGRLAGPVAEQVLDAAFAGGG
jgi:peptidoglycan glycosyltransferase